MRSLRWVIAAVVLMLIIAILTEKSHHMKSGVQDTSDTNTTTTPTAPKQTHFANITAWPDKLQKGQILAVMKVQGRGTIDIALMPKEAPKTVAHFVQLCNEKFYNGILFHRVVPHFVVQAGDPQTKTEGVNGPNIGNGGSGHPIPFEVNNLPNITGSMAMALSAPRSNTGDSQFFIDLTDNASLNGDYCVFGHVIKGMSVVDQIQKGDKIISLAIQK